MSSAQFSFYFLRHGATEPNERGLRCGGDLDVPLTELGRQQARDIAGRIRAMHIDFGVIVCSALKRARETAMIIGENLEIERIVIDPLLNERRLGEWNLLSVSATEPLLQSNVPPPGGESEEAFVARVSTMLDGLPRHIPHRPLIVSSKGIARVLNAMSGNRNWLPTGNGELVRFTMQRRTAAHASAEIHE